MASIPGKKSSGEKRVRQDFTTDEEKNMVEFLAEREPSTRTNIAIYRELTEKAWGSNHSAESWLGRYRRRKWIYDAQIEAFLTKSAAGEDVDESKEELERVPVRKRLRVSQQRTVAASDDGDTFRNLSISFDAFTARPLSENDQFLGFNMAINLLSTTHGVDPGKVYETWKLSGDLHLTDEHLRQTVLGSVENGTDEDDDEIESPLTPQGHGGPDQDGEEEIKNRLQPQDSPAGHNSEVGGESPTDSNPRKRKRSDSTDISGSESGCPVTTPKRPARMYGRAHRSDVAMVVVPSSIPGETEVSPPPRPGNMKTTARRENDVIIPETQPSGSDSDSDSEKSDARKSGSDSDPESGSGSSDDEEESDDDETSRSNPAEGRFQGHGLSAKTSYIPTQTSLFGT
ncbi:hypothetical protein DFH07DRAFT_841888 [Mycena maculata]|uniref:Uncharacterized protein n=1 Tax=Mycena maculata TaxID=230809 RepID=A0AAD7MYB2_9AGAR|nr:hypothetical protein DFH07DRAFT_841888 [Mycena maculata]